MTSRYIYADKIGAGPEHPNKRWGLFSKEITTEEAAERYALNAVYRQDWFGIVLQDSEEGSRPKAYVQMCPRANGVELHKLNPYGSIEAAYTWRAYFNPSDSTPYESGEDQVFLSSITWYVYPEDDTFLRRNQSLGHVTITFQPDGYAKEEKITSHGFGQPSDVETREFKNVDVNANWTKIPEFGEWDAFFNPEAKGIAS